MLRGPQRVGFAAQKAFPVDTVQAGFKVQRVVHQRHPAQAVRVGMRQRRHGAKGQAIGQHQAVVGQ
jgi:hypothetical protein